MRTLRLVGLALGLLTSVAVGSASAEDARTQRDRQGPVTVTVTLATAPSSGSPVTVRVVLDTHSVALDGVAFDRAVTLRNRDGRELAPVAVKELSGGGHHRQAEAVFPSIEGATQVRIVVRDIGGIPERVFAWDVPVTR
jgi:hypothetical protein